MARKRRRRDLSNARTGIYKLISNYNRKVEVRTHGKMGNGRQRVEARSRERQNWEQDGGRAQQLSVRMDGCCHAQPDRPPQQLSSCLKFLIS